VSSRKLHCQAGGGAPSRAGVGVGAGSPQARHQRIIQSHTSHSPKCCWPVAAGSTSAQRHEGHSKLKKKKPTDFGVYLIRFWIASPQPIASGEITHNA
jgi:hypothetical protein